MKKLLLESTEKLKYTASMIVTVIASILSVILSYYFEFSSSKLIIYFIPIILSILGILSFEIWRRKKYNDTIERANIMDYLKELIIKLKKDINKDISANLMVKAGQNQLKILSSDISKEYFPNQYVDINQSASGSAVSYKEPLLFNIDDKNKFEKYSPYIKSQNLSAFIAIPILDDSGKALGVINIDSRDKFTDEDFQKIKSEITKRMEELRKFTKNVYIYSE